MRGARVAAVHSGGGVLLLRRQLQLRPLDGMDVELVHASARTASAAAAKPALAAGAAAATITSSTAFLTIPPVLADGGRLYACMGVGGAWHRLQMQR